MLGLLHGSRDLRWRRLRRGASVSRLLSVALLLAACDTGPPPAPPPRADAGARDAGADAGPPPGTILRDVDALAVGWGHACALVGGDTVYCWGDDVSGQSSGTRVGEINALARPVEGLPEAAQREVAQLALGGWHSCVRTESSELWCWGRGTLGQLGDRSRADRAAPARVLRGATDVSAGTEHTCAVTGPILVCAGANMFGQLGDGTRSRKTSFVMVRDLGGVRAVSAGRFHSCAVGQGGRAWCWGLGTDGQLATGTSVALVPEAAPLGVDSTLSLGHTHSCARSSGRVSCWGSNASGQLGVADLAARAEPGAVPGFEDAISVGAGDRHTCVVTSTGAARCVGANERGQLGDGSRADRRVAVDVELAGEAAAIELGTSFTCALMADRTVACWGRNDRGQLGDGTTLDRDVPAPVLAAP